MPQGQGDVSPEIQPIVAPSKQYTVPSPVAKTCPTPRIHLTSRARFNVISNGPNSVKQQGSTHFSDTTQSLGPKIKTPKNQSTEGFKRPKPRPQDDKYRDRALERRQANDSTNMELHSEVSDLSAEEMLQRLEESKKLGGSEDTTHLVQGVDSVLLEKRTLEIQEERLREKMRMENSSQPMLPIKHLVMTQDGKAKAVDAPTEFQTHLGRSIYNVLFRREMPVPINSFLPGHTTYSFNIDPKSSFSVPSIIEHTIEVSYHRDIRYESVLASTSPEFLKKLGIVMSYIKQGEKGIKQRRADLEAKEKRAMDIIKNVLISIQKGNESDHGGDDDDDDIFDDVKGQVYVTTPSYSSTHHEKVNSNPGLWKKVVESYGQDQEDMTSLKRQKLVSKTSNPTPKSDLGICSFEKDEYDGLDDDGYSDDEDIMAMDNRVKLKRADFETDQDWEKYEANREAIPKAAFQFGIKLGDGRRIQRRGKSEKKRIYHVLQKKVPGSIGKEN